jgi:hypothetical protein
MSTKLVPTFADRGCRTYEDKRNALGFWWGSQKERDHQEDEDVGGRIILKSIIQG